MHLKRCWQNIHKFASSLFPSQDAPLPSGLPKLVDDSEIVARVLTSSGQFNAVMVKPAAFLPNPKDRKKSVFRHDAIPPEELWEMAQEHLKEGTRIYGAATVLTSQVRAAELDVIAEEPPPRHANIEGWPWIETDPELRKAQHMELALQICQHATLMTRK